MFDLKTHDQDCLQRCIAYCGKIDRLMYKFQNDYSPDPSITKRNAGYSGDLEPDTRSGFIARGTLEWLQEHHADPDSFSLSNTSVKAIHRKIFKYSPRDDGTRGRYRTESDDDMRQLFDNVKNALSSDLRHPLFIISLFRTTFINRMPFVTGNSLCANLLSYALLNTHGFPVVTQLPLLAFLNNDKGAISTDNIAFLPEILFNELTVYSLSPILPNATKTYLNPRRKDLLDIIRLHAPLKISDIMMRFPEESRNTIKKDLIYLREKGMIVSHGEGRGMYYVMMGEK